MTSQNRKKYYLSAFISGIIFFLFSLMVSTDIFRQFDYEATLFMQNAISRKFDVFLSIFTPLGSTEITLGVLIAIFFYVCWKKRHLFWGLSMYLLIFVLEIAGKMFIFHPDPPQFLNRYALGLKLPSSFMVHTNFAYPSGHVARIIFITIVMTLLISNVKKITNKKMVVFFGLFLFALMTLISRVYLGEHWVSDVVGGVILGAFSASLAFAFW